jgi:hypothetical protein
MTDLPRAGQVRPWYREPWPWVLIAIPLLTVIASAATLWLALSHPDYLVIETPEYEQVQGQLRAQADHHPDRATEQANGER